MPRLEGTQLEKSRSSREAPTKSSLVFGWQEQTDSEIAWMLKMTCQTAGAAQLGGSWRPTHRTSRMTSCGFDDLVGEGKPHQGLTGRDASPDGPNVRFACLMRRNVPSLSCPRLASVRPGLSRQWRRKGTSLVRP